MAFLTVTASQVKPGDSLYLGDNYAKNPNMRWGYIKKIRRQPACITMVTSDTERSYSPDEPVMIQRFDEDL